MKSAFKRILNKMSSKQQVASTEALFQPQDMIHNRIGQFASNNPTATEYVLNTEEEATELLYSMCAVLDKMASESRSHNAKKYRSQCIKLKGVIERKEALKYIGANNYNICGLALVGLTG